MFSSPRQGSGGIRAVCLCFLLLVSLPAAAQQRGLLGLYAGIGVGRFQFEEDRGPVSVEVDDSLADGIIGGATRRIGIPSRLDDSELAWKLFGGWNVTRNLGVEVSYGWASELTSTYSGQVGDMTVSANLSTDINIGTARAMGYLPFRVGAVFVGLGYFNAETSSTQNVGLTVAGAGGVPSTVNLGGSATESGPAAIVGFQWALSSLLVRADFELFDMNAGRAATLNVGVSLGF